MATMKAGKIKFTNEASEAAFGYLKGEAKWAELLTVGQFGTYGIKLYGDQVVEMKEELTAMQESAAAEVDELGKKYELADLFKVDDEGKQYLAFKLPETDFEGKMNKIKMYDAGGNHIEDWDKLVGNGSVVKIKYRIAPYYMGSTKKVGISFKFYACQVINLVEFKQGDAGFGDESGDAIPDTSSKEGEDF